MPRPAAVLIGFQDQGNLGLGYLSAVLEERGFGVLVLDFREGAGRILEAIRSAQPVVVGFSLIFQYYLPQFAQLAAFLRENGIACHFCAGGHYPSLAHEAVLRAVPELDCVVRCEGELTLLELMQLLAEQRDWRSVDGIAYRQGDQCVLTRPRRLIADLDELPFPTRTLESLSVLGKRASALLASRGCARHCSFCSIRQFYAQTPGKKVRVRDPAKVVGEMKSLHEDAGVCIFLFQDDDFPLWGALGERWVARFLEALRTEDLYGRVIWKISCRADEVEPQLFARLRDAGLYLAYLGLESGTATGLEILNKRLKVEDSLRAVATLKELDLAFAFGFMLFDPSSTFASVRANAAFLRKITGDGRAAVVFGRMMPYAGTPIEQRLAREGRLHGSVEDPDYDFIDPRLNSYFLALNKLVAGWLHGGNALTTQLNWAWHEYWIMRRLFPVLGGMPAYEDFLRSITRRSNEYLLQVVQDSASAFEQDNEALPSASAFQEVRSSFSEELLEKRDAFVLRNQETMLEALAPANAAG